MGKHFSAADYRRIRNQVDLVLAKLNELEGAAPRSTSITKTSAAEERDDVEPDEHSTE